MEKNMMAALAADGEKLRQQTGNEHGPFCPRCLINPLGQRPIFLNSEGAHICGDCWAEDHHAEYGAPD